MTTTPAARRMSLVSVMVYCGVIGMIVGGMSAAINLFDGPIASTAIVGLCVFAMAMALVLTIIWWRRADEAVREAHKWAWWWGGSSGMGIATALLLVVHLRPQLIGGLADLEPSILVITAIALVLGLQLTGYLVAWAWWWLSKR